MPHQEQKGGKDPSHTGGKSQQGSQDSQRGGQGTQHGG